MDLPEDLVRQLCTLLQGNNGRVTTEKNTQYALRVFSCFGEDSVPDVDEYGLIEKIKLLLMKNEKTDAVIQLSMLHRNLKKSDQIKNLWSILYLLHSLSSVKDINKFPGGSLLFRQGLVSSSTPLNSTARPNNNSTNTSSGFGTAAPHSSRGGFSSISQLPSEISTNGNRTASTDLPSRLGWAITPSTTQSNSRTGHSHTNSQFTQPSSLENITNRSSKIRLSKGRVGEASLVRQLLYVFQGRDAKDIKYSSREDAFCVDHDVDIDKRHKQIVDRLGMLGWLHNKIQKYITTHDRERAFGLVGQAFCAVLQQELREYFRLLSFLESQIQQMDAGIVDESVLTLHKMLVWSLMPLERFKWIAAMVDNCQGKKGGELASMVHAFMHTGDPKMRKLTRHILQVVAQPIFHYIDRWMYHGELNDPFHEFFVGADLSVGIDRLWIDKYKMRPSMIPSFIKNDEARRILLVGKSINFLRLVCRDSTIISIENHLVPKEEAFKDSYGLDFATGLKNKVDHAHEATSSHLLDVLNQKYKLLTHLHALRKFLLLGQGDFIRHLLDALEEELSRSANHLYRHNLTGPVEAAVRASNAQFEDADVLARLDFRLLEINPGDMGWDVFSLDYHIDPPLNTLITPEVMLVYLRIFIFLWRAKRMEYNLALIWSTMMEQSRRLSPSSLNMKGILHTCHTLASEMVHFVHQMQYYIAFEVLECSWADFQAKLEEAKDLDEVIVAHNFFLESLLKRCLLDQSSSNLLNQLRTIFDQIVKFEQLQKQIYEQSCFELEAREKFDRAASEAAKKGVWGMENEKDEMKRRKEFSKVRIPDMRAKLKVCSVAYQDMVVMFLRQLCQEGDPNLRNLSWRLDFNENYRAKDYYLRSMKPGQKMVLR